MRVREAAIFAVVCAVVLVGASSSQPVAAREAKRPIVLEDIVAWKSLSTAAVSADGEWLAYRVSPDEGDSEVVLRQTHGTKEMRFPIGEVPLPNPFMGPGGPSPSSSLVFSDDSKWLAFTVYTAKAEAARLKKQRKPVQNSAALVSLATGDKTEYPKVRTFAFAGERAGWIALQRYPPEPAPGAGAPAGTPPGPGGAAPGAAGARTPPRGSDLILRELSTGAELNIGNVSGFSFDKKGLYLAYAVEAADKIGNGVVLRDMTSGDVTPLDSGKASYEHPTWTENGDGLAVLKGVEDKAYKDPLYSVIGFKGFSGQAKPQKTVFNPADDKTFPQGMSVSSDRAPRWSEDLAALIFGIHAAKKKDAAAIDKPDQEERKDKDADEPSPDDKVDLVLWHWQDKRLQSMQEVQEQRDRAFNYTAEYRVDAKKFIRLADDTVRDVSIAPKDHWAIGLDDSQYELMSNLDGREFQDVYAINMATGERKLAVKRVRWFTGPSPAGDALLYYDDGHYFVYSMTSGQATNITKAAPVSFVDTENDQNIVKPPTRPIGWAADGKSVLLSDNWDVWQVPASGGAATNLTVNGRKDSIRYRNRYRLDRDEKGIDLSKPQYFDAYGEWTKKSGIARIGPGQPGVKLLAWDDAGFGRLLKADKADVYLFTRETAKDAPEYYVADAALARPVKLTNVGAQQDAFLWSSGGMLVNYACDKGQKMQGALFLPANYQKGKAYPTIVYIYERLSQGLNRYTTPTANGFNKSVYTSNGYAVLMPDIAYQVNDPGNSAVWCVLPALKAAIATGVVDRARVGLQGHSWGGYQTAFLVTQTDAFAAAIAGAPLTNMISMYSLIYKNSGATNQAIFESSQGRFKGGYWDNWEAYVRNSPVVFAKNVKTPLVILHDDKDGAVDFTQGVEYYNTLRRLQKPVVLLEYVGENHGLRKPANRKDYTVRMKEFFDHFLMGAPAPDWWKAGISRIDMEEHLKQRAKPIAAPAKKTTTG